MPSKNYSSKLTHEQIIELFDCGLYYADLGMGIVYSGKTKKPLFTFFSTKQEDKDNEDYLWLRLYKSPAMRSIPVAHVIWIVGARNLIPPNFEIHHDNKNRGDNSFDNLFCVHKTDHRKFHKRKKPIPF